MQESQEVSVDSVSDILHPFFIHTCNPQGSDDMSYGSDMEEFQRELLMKKKKVPLLKKGSGSTKASPSAQRGRRDGDVPHVPVQTREPLTGLFSGPKLITVHLSPLMSLCHHPWQGFSCDTST